MKFKRFEYPLVEGKQHYYGSYTIRADVEPLHFKGERLVQEFEAEVKNSLK